MFYTHRTTLTSSMNIIFFKNDITNVLKIEKNKSITEWEHALTLLGSYSILNDLYSYSDFKIKIRNFLPCNSTVPNHISLIYYI